MKSNVNSPSSQSPQEPTDSATHVDTNSSSEAWTILAGHVEGFVAAWDGEQAPPDIRDFLPDTTGPMRRLALLETIKIDLEYRWLHHRLPRKVEEYLDEFPDLSDEGFPCDLVYEEFHIRRQAGEEVDGQKFRARWDLDFTGKQMPPPEAVAAGKVEPLSDEDRRTLVRWIDLGCPIDLDYREDSPEERGYGWQLDDNRPVLSVTYPQPGVNEKLDRILIGMHDYYTGIDPDSLVVTADFPIEDAKPGDNLASHFKQKSAGVWELRLGSDLGKVDRAKLNVSVKDRQGNTRRIERTFSVK